MIPIGSVSPAGIPAPAPVGGTHAAAAPARPAAAADPKIAEAAKGFEGIFMSMLVNEMFKNTELTKSNSIYSGLMTEKFGDALSQSGGFGFAQMLTDQWGGTA